MRLRTSIISALEEDPLRALVNFMNFSSLCLFVFCLFVFFLLIHDKFSLFFLYSTAGVDSFVFVEKN